MEEKKVIVGTAFDSEGGELGDWFPFFESHYNLMTGETVYDEPKEGAAEFRIRSMASFYEERRKGRKKRYQMVVNPSNRAMERVGYYEDLTAEEEQQERDDAWDYAITGMKNAFFGDEPIECTKANKLRLVKVPVFIRYIQRVFELINDSGAKAKEAAEKN